jgi:hypothetical protein
MRKKTTRAVREPRRVAAGREDVRRAKIEGQIKLGTVALIEWEDAVALVLCGEQLSDDVLVIAPPTPAVPLLWTEKSHRPNPAIRAQVLDWEIDAYIQRGFTAEQAKWRVVENRKLRSLPALGQMLRRSRKSD